MSGLSAMNGRRAGLLVWKVRSVTSAALPRKCCSTTTVALVVRHDRATREVQFNARLQAFARHWRFRPRACAPYRARTGKGKDERGVGYVKKNAIAGRGFESWSSLEAHLVHWMREVADQRDHGTTGERPIERFARAEEMRCGRSAGVAPFAISRELLRKVQADCAIEVDSNSYSVPWRLIGETVRVVVSGQLRVSHAGRDVAIHPRCDGRFERSIDPLHLKASSAAARAVQPRTRRC